MSDSFHAFHSHDHKSCAVDVLARADRRAESTGIRLTPVRRRVLEILVEQHRALGAYEILERLKSDGFGSQPPVAYRALDFLVENGFAHRIRRLNAFTACMSSDDDHAPAFLICKKCDAIAELTATKAEAALLEKAAEIDFVVSRMNIEVLGTCPACADE